MQDPEVGARSPFDIDGAVLDLPQPVQGIHQSRLIGGGVKLVVEEGPIVSSLAPICFKR